MASESATAAKNVSLMRRFVYELQEQRKVELINELIGSDFQDHKAGGQSPGTRDDVEPLLRRVWAAFPDLKMEITQCIGQGNVVATNKVFRGTLSAEFMGQPPTGKMVELRVMDFVKIEEGLIREHWATTGAIVPVEPAV